MKVSAAILISLIALSSCRVSKDMTSALERTNSAYKDSIEKLKQTISRKDIETRKAVEEARKASVVFSTPCPGFDEMNALREKLDEAGKEVLDQFAKDNLQKEKIQKLENRLRVNADGSFELSGQIESVNLELLQKTVETSKLKEQNDSLLRVTKSLTGSLTREIVNKRTQKASRPAFAGHIIVLIIGLILGVLLRHFITKLNIFKTSNMKNVLLTLLIGSMLFLESCGGKFKDGTSVFAEGLWLVPTLLLTGGSIFLSIAYRQSKSNSERQRVGGGYDRNLGNMKITKLWRFRAGVLLILLGLAAWIGINYFRA
jgi:hypothetical protein